LAVAMSKSTSCAAPEVACIMREDHALAKRRWLGPADLANETLVSFADDTMTGWRVRDAFRASGIPCHVTFSVNHTMTAYALARSGRAIAIVDPFPMVSGAYAGLTMRSFRPSIEIKPTAGVLAHATRFADRPQIPAADGVRRGRDDCQLESAEAGVSLRMTIRVECYAGYRGEQEPIAFWLGDRRLAVQAIVDRWFAPTRRWFRVGCRRLATCTSSGTTSQPATGISPRTEKAGVAPRFPDSVQALPATRCISRTPFIALR
jgi:hypothetical protein